MSLRGNIKPWNLYLLCVGESNLSLSLSVIGLGATGLRFGAMLYCLWQTLESSLLARHFGGEHGMSVFMVFIIAEDGSLCLLRFLGLSYTL